MSDKFKRNIENFECSACGAFVEGNGYTNHCPNCLVSKHVDVFPGDRASQCLGLMHPTGVAKDGESYTLEHKCCKCAHTKKNKLAKNDSMDRVIELVQKLSNNEKN